MAVKNDWSYSDDYGAIVLPNGKPGRTKKLTGTRFAAALGFNRWKSPFQVWCEITKVAEPPFEGNKYTEAGNAIEPILVDYLQDQLDALVMVPEVYWGNLYDEKRYGFFKDTPIFDGMWDGLEFAPDGTPRAIVECKTTKRAQDWVDGPPAYYLAQALLYAALQGVNKVIFAAAFLEDGDYAHPERFVCTDENTGFWFFDVDETTIELNGRAYDIFGLMELATDWWNAHVETGISPHFDETVDAEYLKLLRTANLAADNDTDAILSIINDCEAKIAAVRAETGIDAIEKELDGAKKALKKRLADLMGDTDEYAEAGEWRLSRSITWKVDEDAMKEHGVYDDYARPVESMRLAKKPKNNG